MSRTRCFHRSFYQTFREELTPNLLMCSIAYSCPTLLQPSWTVANQASRSWDFPSKNTGAVCHFLFQGIILSKGLYPCLLCLLHWQVDSLPLSHLEGQPETFPKNFKGSLSKYRHILRDYRLGLQHRNWRGPDLSSWGSLSWWLSDKESICQCRRCRFDPLEEEMATHSSVLAWEIPQIEESGGLQSMGLQVSWTRLSD